MSRAKQPVKLANSDRKKIDKYIFKTIADHDFTREQRDFSYQRWWRGGSAWGVLHKGGTGQMLALMWYHPHPQTKI